MSARASIPPAAAVLALAVALAWPAPAAAETITFRFEVRTSLGADPDRFSVIARQALNSRRGWSLGRRIRFRTAPGDTDFRLVLAAPGVVANAAPVCSARWSCRVGNRVYINERRWLEQTPTWPGNLYTYRLYVINHEVGHWLGLGHRSCPGAGEAAPVMMQQSLGFRPCRANVWPEPYELERAARLQGVSWEPDAPILYLDGFVGSPENPRWRERHGATAAVEPENVFEELVGAARAARREGSSRIASVRGGLLYWVNRHGNFERIA